MSDDLRFDQLLREDASGLPPAMADVNPWREAMWLVLWGMGLTTITFNFLYLDMILPALGGILMVLGFRTLRQENKALRWCWRLSIVIAAVRSASFVLEALPVDVKYVPAYAIMAMTFALYIGLWRGMVGVSRAAGAEKPAAPAAGALVIFYVALGALAFLKLEGWLAVLPVLIVYIVILRNLVKLARSLSDTGYAIHAAPVRLPSAAVLWGYLGLTLAAMLLACWAMMNLHGLMELNFSIRAYQCAAFFLLAAVIALYGTPLLKKEPGRFVRYTAAGLSVVYLVTYGVLVWNNWAVNREREEFTTTSAVAYLSALESFAQRNVLDPEDLQLRYVAQAVTMELDEGQQATMLSYVDTLRGSGTYIACTGLAQMYYLPAGELEEVFASSLEGIGQVASNADAWNEQMDFYRTKVLPAAGTEGAVQVAAGVRQLGQAMDAYNEGRVQPVELSEQNQVFLNSANTAWEKNFSDEATFQLLLTSSGLSVSTGE